VRDSLLCNTTLPQKGFKQMATFSSGSRVHEPSEDKVDSYAFYREYSGHPVEQLRRILPHLRDHSQHLIWTAGDSSLDNKYWLHFHDNLPAVRGAYRNVLHPPTSKPDVTYWLNYLAATMPPPTLESPRADHQKSTPFPSRRWAAINAAVEASTLNERTFRLRPQDVFLRDNIAADDVLVVSVGGNDIALLPCPCTIVSMASLVLCMPQSCIDRGRICATVPLDDCCCGCGPSLCSCCCACPPCLGYFAHLFGRRIQYYIEALTAKTKPSKILVCMIYYPEEVSHGRGWADPALSALRYDSNPAKLQALIRKIYNDSIRHIRIQGSQVIPVPLFQVMDGKASDDYVARVEPSTAGGRKMAEFLLALIEGSRPMTPPPVNTSTVPTGIGSANHAASSATTMGYVPVAAPSSSLIQGRN
jgi:hypothetical protein